MHKAKNNLPRRGAGFLLYIQHYKSYKDKSYTKNLLLIELFLEEDTAHKAYENDSSDTVTWIYDEGRDLCKGLKKESCYEIIRNTDYNTADSSCKVDLLFAFDKGEEGEYSGKEEDKEHKSVVIFAVTNELEYFGCGVAEATNKEKEE